MKSSEEAMEILEAYDRTLSLRAAADLAGCSHHTVARYVRLRAQGRSPGPATRSRKSIIEPFRPKIEEWVAHSGGRIRADVCHRWLTDMDYSGSKRTVRRAVAEAKRAWRRDNRRVYRPWITEPGMWAQWDWGDAGPIVGGRQTYLFCCWLAWSRYRVVIPTRDRKMETLICCLDQAMRAFGGVPTYWLTDNERTVTSDYVAGLGVRNRQLAACAAHYGCRVLACERADPQSKGGSENCVKLAKADLVPTDANLLPGYGSWEDLLDECEAFLVRVNAREHRVTGEPPVERLGRERGRLNPLPAEPFTPVFGQTRRVSDDAVVTYQGSRYSVPHALADETVWVREQSDELIVTADDGSGLREVARHALAGKGRQVVDESHYTDRPPGPLARRPRPRNDAEKEFLDIGPNAERWLVAAAAAGSPQLRRKLEEIVTLARLGGAEEVDLALGVAASCGCFGFGDVASIMAVAATGPQYRARPESFLQEGTRAWKDFGLTDGEARE